MEPGSTPLCVIVLVTTPCVGKRCRLAMESLGAPTADAVRGAPMPLACRYWARRVSRAPPLRRPFISVLRELPLIVFTFPLF